MWNVIKELLSSKKAIMAIVGVIVWFAGYLGLHLDAAALAEAITPIIVYILGQSVADHGKEAAKITAAALPKMTVVK